MPIAIAVCLIQGLAADLARENPILRSGEERRESDTGLRKVGDGITPWNALPYDSGGGAGGGTAGVATFNGRQGDVVPAVNDYTPTMVGAEPAGAVAAHSVDAGGHPEATPTTPGFQSAADKVKLDGIAVGAQVNAQQISPAEIAAPTGTAIRSVSPADLNAFVAANTPGGAAGTTETPYVLVGNATPYTVPAGGADYEWTGGLMRMRVNFRNALRMRSSIIVVTAGSAGTEAFLQYSRAATPGAGDWTTIPNSTFSLTAAVFLETSFTAVLADMKVDAEVWVRAAAHNGNGSASPSIRLFTLYLEQAGSGGGTGAVSSVNGRTGAVTLLAADVGLGNVTNDAQIKAALAYGVKGSPTTSDYVLGKDGATNQPILISYAPPSAGGSTTYAEIAPGTTGKINAPDADIVLCFNTAAISINLPTAPRNSMVFWCFGGLITFFGGDTGSGQSILGGSFTTTAGTASVPTVYPFVRRQNPNNLVWARGN